jgi:hypothetical protein
MFGWLSRRKRDEELFRQMLVADTQRRRLEQFGKVILAAAGRTPPTGQHSDVQTCGAVAGLFAVAVNGGRTLLPKERLTDEDIAVLWTGFVAVDMASQATGTDFEFASLAMMSWMFDLGDVKDGPTAERAGELVGDALAETGAIHNKLSLAPQSTALASTIANAFYKWATADDHQGLNLLRRQLPGIAQMLHVFWEKGESSRPTPPSPKVDTAAIRPNLEAQRLSLEDLGARIEAARSRITKR